MKPTHPEPIDESAESEITIQPDGRIFAFGITPQLVELLASIPTEDDRAARRRLERLKKNDDATSTQVETRDE